MLARARPGRRSPVPVLSFVAVSGYRGGLIAIKGACLDLVALTCELHLVRSRRLRSPRAAPVTPVLDGQQPSALTNFQGQVAQLFYTDFFVVTDMLPACSSELLPCRSRGLVAQHLTSRPTQDLDSFTRVGATCVPDAGDASKSQPANKAGASRGSVPPPYRKINYCVAPLIREINRRLLVWREPGDPRPS